MSWRSYISTDNGHYNFCMLIAFLIPLHKKYVPGFLGLFLLYAIYYAIKRRRWYFEKSTSHFLIPVALYGMMALGLSAAMDEASALKELEYKASMLLFPMLAILTPKFSIKEAQQILHSFVIGCLVFMLFAIGYGIYRAAIFDSREYLTYSKLGIYFHPTYMAMYQSLTLLVLLMRGMKMNFLFRKKWLHWSLTMLVILFIVMLASKAGLISAGIAILWALFVSVRRGIIHRHAIAVCLASLVLLIGLTFTLPLTAQRVESATADAAQAAPAEVAHTSTELRKVTWTAAVDLIKRNPFGVGVGNASIEMNRSYIEMGQNYAAEKNLNAHNQFLQVGVELGWIGLLSFLFFLIIHTIKAVESRSYFYQALIGLSMLNFLFESFLEVQAGVVFFYFLLMIFDRIDYNTSETIWI